MLTYFRFPHPYSVDTMKEITYEEALDIVLGTYADTDMTRDMLTIPNRINCLFSTIEVKDGNIVLMAGLENMLPMDVEYDDHGKRIK